MGSKWYRKGGKLDTFRLELMSAVGTSTEVSELHTRVRMFYYFLAFSSRVVSLFGFK